MLLIAILTTLRIFSNSLSGVFQKKLARNLSSVLINFISYLILSLFCLFGAKEFVLNNYAIWMYAILTGIFGALGNSFQIKALKNGELSILAPLNSYKIIFSLIFGFILLGEVPNLAAFLGVILIFWGSFFVFETVDNKNNKFSFSLFRRKDICYRLIAVLFTALEAIFIKKIIILSNSMNALFLWALMSCIVSLIFFVLKSEKSFKFSGNIIVNLLFLSFTMGIMQYSTNILFKMMNVSYALCLFQLSIILSIFLGYKIFGEKNLIKKIFASLIMITGAVLIILNI